MARLIALLLVAGIAQGATPDYAVVASAATRADPEWARVVAELEARHEPALRVVFTQELAEVAGALREAQPRWVCFVAPPQEAGRAVVADIHRLVRALDEDPYTDARWGILTGRDASNALAIARRRDPLTVRDVLSGTPVALDRCESGAWYSELNAGEIARKASGEAVRKETGPADSTAALVAALNGPGADLFVTSGHATERDWQIGYRYRGGQFRCEGGRLFGLDTEGGRHPVDSARARVYLPVGNCLMGHVDGPDCMALAFMNSAGVTQMAGYTVPTWFGYAGWGMLDYFLEQPGRFSLAEAFLANQHALDHRLAADPPGGKDRKGLEFDRTVLAFYGDPAWEARMAAGPLNWKQELTRDGSRFVLEITPLAGDATFKAVDTNGSQRGGRPIVAFLPARAGQARVVAGSEWNPVVADDFILVPLPAAPPEQPMRIVVETAGGHHVRSGEAAPGEDAI